MKIYCHRYYAHFDPWANNVVALCEDGHVLAAHWCSNESCMQGDIGIGTKSKHELYNAHCGVGQWQLEWVDDDERGTNPGFLAALAKYRERREEEERQ
jgi:hypothetical protein